MHFIHELVRLSVFYIKLLLFFKNLVFPEFRSIECVFWSIENSLNFLILVLTGLINSRLVFDQSNLFFQLIESKFRSIEIFKSFYRKLSAWLDWYPINAQSIEFWKKRTKRYFSITCASLFKKQFLPFSSFSSSTNPIQAPFSFSSSIFPRVFVLKHW